jgi:surface antigen
MAAKRRVRGVWTLRYLHFALAAFIVLSLAVPATAQINPFRSNRNGPTLSATDLDLLGASVNRLNQKQDLQVGAEEKWSNPATGSYGSSTVSRIFTKGKLPCHAMHHEVFAQGREPSRTYDLTWCRVANGQWKIAS